MNELDKLDVSADELQPFRFQGQFFDSETSLHYNRFRYYDSDVGMFIQRDPIDLNGGVNIFAYAPNPIQWIDPLGLNNYDLGALGITPEGAKELEYRAHYPPAENKSKVNAYINSFGDAFRSGANTEAEAGATVVAGIGVRQNTGAVIDTAGKRCLTTTTCGLVGPMVGAYTHAGGSVSSGTITSNSRTWQLSYLLGGTFGFGVGTGGSINSDGSVTLGGEGSVGAGAGGAIMICSKKVTKTCNK